MLHSQTKTNEPDGRLLRAARGEPGLRKIRVEGVHLAPCEREAFYRQAYGEGRTPSFFMRRFAEAYLGGASVPALFGPRPTAMITFEVSQDMHERLRARADAECASLSAVLRRFMLAYVRDRVGEPPDQKYGGGKPTSRATRPRKNE